MNNTLSDTICMGCMKEHGEENPCPHCGYNAETPQLSPYLPVKALIGGRYMTGKLLEYNGDGATYIGWDTQRNAKVRIREFMPDAIATRTAGDLNVKIMAGCEVSFSDCLNSFLDLWKNLARMRGLSAIVLVIDIIMDHGTAYAICEDMEGITLREYLLKSNYGYISWEQARALFMPLLGALGTLHNAGIIHRGISPTTIMVNSGGKMYLTGFSIPQVRTAGSDLTAQLYSGYAALEQYGSDKPQGAWTDLYAFSAVLYRALIGSTPIDAKERAANDRLMVPGKLAEQLPAYVINALINSLQILPEDRTRSAKQLRDDLSASPVAASSSINYTPAQNSAPVKPSPKAISDYKIQAAKKAAAIKAGVFSALTILVIFAAVIAISSTVREKIFNNGSSSSDVSLSDTSGQVQVPNFVANSSYAQIMETKKWQEDFDIEYDHAYSNTVPSGMIISQSIEAYKTVAPGTKIKLLVSRGVERVEIPASILGMDYDAAKTILENLGFKCTKVDKTNDGSEIGNTIASIDKTAGQKYNKGTELFIQVWTQLEESKPDIEIS